MMVRNVTKTLKSMERRSTNCNYNKYVYLSGRTLLQRLRKKGWTFKIIYTWFYTFLSLKNKKKINKKNRQNSFEIVVSDSF